VQHRVHVGGVQGLLGAAGEGVGVGAQGLGEGGSDDTNSRPSRSDGKRSRSSGTGHPSLECVLGPRLDHQAVTWLLERYGSPAALRKAGRRRLVEVIRPKAPRMATRLIDDVFDALDEQTVVVPGTGTLDIVIPSLARSLGAVHEQHRAAEAQISALLEAHPLSALLRLARQRINALFAMLRDGTFYEPRTPRLA
ncbi:hypothetical protein ABZV46_43870, partial [Streptomyces sp. NPDC005209]